MTTLLLATLLARPPLYQNIPCRPYCRIMCQGTSYPRRCRHWGVHYCRRYGAPACEWIANIFS